MQGQTVALALAGESVSYKGCIQVAVSVRAHTSSSSSELLLRAPDGEALSKSPGSSHSVSMEWLQSTAQDLTGFIL